MTLVVRRWRAHLDEAFADRGLTYARWAVLHWTAQHPGGISQRALTELVGVEPPVLSRHLDVLQAQGLVRRVPAPDDRRANLVEITEAAEPIVSEIQAVLRAEISSTLSGLNMQKIDNFLDVLHIINSRLGEAVAAERAPRRRVALARGA